MTMWRAEALTEARRGGDGMRGRRRSDDVAGGGAPRYPSSSRIRFTISMALSAQS